MGARVEEHCHPTGPIRTCIATRTLHPATELLRVVARYAEQGIEVIPDPARREPGRGAWITPTLAAYNRAVAQRAFHRAFKTSVVNTKQLGDYLAHSAATASEGDQMTTNDHRKI